MATYKCNGAAGTRCTVNLDADGAIIAISDGWIFTPDTGETVDVADAKLPELRLLVEADHEGRRDHLQRGRDLRDGYGYGYR